MIATGDFETEDEEEFGEMFVVGTSLLKDENEGPEEETRGRIIVFEVDQERRLRRVTDLEVRGACRSLAMCEGKVVAGLVKAVIACS